MGEYTTCATLLARLSAGVDPGAWREFCDRYGALIDGFARRRGLQEADRDEVVQEVLAALARALPGFRYDPARGKFRAYLKTATLHAIGHLARQGRGVRLLGDGELDDAVGAQARDPAVDATWEAEWRQYHLALAMRTVEVEFSERDRAAFRSYAVDGDGAPDVAARLGISIDQVYQAKSRILRRLAALVRAQVEDEG
jgi:RNA polymerase sigma-70 factor (ECF subfamily)